MLKGFMNKIKVFENKKVRTAWNEETEDWFFSVIDVIEILTESENPRRYWSDLKRKSVKEGSQLYEGIVQLKMLSSDGKYYKTDVATTFPTNPIYPITQSPQRNLIPNPIFHIVRRNESVLFTGYLLAFLN